jgi:hypothetical protein
LHVAESPRLVEVQLTGVPQGIGTHQDVLAQYQLTKRSEP